ncbi:CBS domain-containing protein [Peptococcaceae bacterium 1198_IL3148]
MIGIKEKTVKELMIPLEQYSKVSPDDTVADAVKILINSYRNTGLHHRTVLVVSGTRLVGLLTMRNLLASLDPALFSDRYLDENYWVEITPAVELLALEELFTERCRKNCCKKVGAIMQPLDLITIEHNASLLKAIHLMVKNHINLLPVMNGEDVIGTIRMVEIVEEVHNLILEMPECNI